MARRATAQDVADLAGVSRSAVSLVLNGRGAGNISAVKQEAIRDAARQLSYTPNAVALSLRQQRTRTFGVLSWAGFAGAPLSLLGATYSAAARVGYVLLTVNPVEQPAAVDGLLDRQVDGFLVVAPELVDYAVPEALVAVPTVLVNCSDPTRQTTSLVPDELGAGVSAAQLLIEAGHVRIGVLAHGDGGLLTERRVQGVRRQVAAAGLPEPSVLATGRDVAGGHTAALAVLGGPERPTALVTTHERLAVGALLAASQLQLAVPDDLSLVSLDDGERLAPRLVPPLTVVVRPDESIAGYALDALVEMLRGGAGSPRQLSFVCPVRPGGSVAGAPVG